MNQAKKKADLQIISNFFYLTIFLFFAKGCGALKEMLVASYYGVSPIVDAYVLVFNLLAWIGSLLGGAPFFALLPPLIARWKNKNTAELLLFQKELLGLICCFSLIASILGPGCLWIALKCNIFNQAAILQQYCLAFLAPLSLTIAPGIFIALFSAWIMAENKQFNTLIEGIPPLTICFCFLFSISLGTLPLISGTVLGFFLQFCILAIFLIQKKSLTFPKISFSSQIWKDFTQNCTVLILGQMALSLSSTFDLIAATNLAVGNLAVLNYANRILMLIVNLGGIVLTRATLPVFSQLQTNEHEMKIAAARWSKYAFFLGLLAMGGSYFLAPWMIKILFERGAFEHSATILVTENFRYALIQIPFYFSWILITSVLSAQWKFKFLTIIFLVNMLIKLLLLFILTPILGINGIQLSYMGMYIISLIFIFMVNKFYFCEL